MSEYSYNIQEEEEPNLRIRKKGLLDSPSVLKLGCGIFIVAIFAISVAILALQKNIQDKLDNVTPVVTSSEISSEMMEYIIEDSEKARCVDSFTATALATCERECNREFCSGEFETEDVCRGECYPMDDATLEDCRSACVCCELRKNCLLKHSNDKGKCDTDLQSQCGKFVPPEETFTHQVSDVCYSLFGMCRRTNFGFNELISCN